MLRHLLRLTWKRKSRHLMLSLEILLAFVIVFGIAAFGLRYWQLYRQPVGYDGTDTWSVTMQMGEAPPKSIPPDVYDTLRRSLLELPEVRAVSFATYAPYTRSRWTTTYAAPQTGAAVQTDLIEASDDLPEALGMRLVAGRWFSTADDGQDARPAVLNRRMAAELFGGRPALGQRFTSNDNGVTRTLRVVGLVDTFA